MILMLGCRDYGFSRRDLSVVNLVDAINEDPDSHLVLS